MDDVRGKLPHAQIPPGVRVRLISFPYPSPLEAKTMRDHPQDGRALADTPKRGAIIYDDTAQATPLDNPAGYDLGTCDQKHQRMMAYQARRIDKLQFDLEAAAGEIAHLRAVGLLMDARLAALEAILEDWSAGK